MRSRLLFSRRALVAFCAFALLAGGWFAATSRAVAVSTRHAARVLARNGLDEAQVPRERIAWLLAVEDPGFYGHHGVDLTTPGAGWTTLTQSLVKIYFPGPNRGVLGKPLQTLRALILDATLSKSEQLTLFFSSAYFGEGPAGPVIGFHDAARVYYQRPLNELGSHEYLGLVAMLVGPDEFNPIHNPGGHAERLRRIEALVAGKCQPHDWEDVVLEDCGDVPADATVPPATSQ